MSKIKNTSKRLRYWEVVVYIDENELFKILWANGERISHYVYALHDKDTYDEDDIRSMVERAEKEGKLIDELPKVGDLKKPHFHLLVDFFNAHTFSAVKKIFTTENDNPRVKEILSRQGAFEYLTHKNNPDKYQYSYDILKSDEISYYEKFCKEGYATDRDCISEMILHDILNKVPPRLLAKRYKREFIINMQRYYDCADKIKMWEIEHPVSNVPTGEELIRVQQEIPFE